MQISQRNLTRIMKMEDLRKRKAKIQELCLSIGWHGGVWMAAMEELNRLNEMGIKTQLEEMLSQKK